MASNKIFLDADIVQLLAWLDFCAKTQVDFGETISDHLVQSRKERGEKDYPFTKIQAQDKLNGLARQSHKETYQHEILQAGSAYFTCLSSEIKAEIEIVLTQLLKLRSQQSRSYGATRAKSATADTLMPDPPLEAPTRKSMWRGKRKSQQNQPGQLTGHHSTRNSRNDHRIHQKRRKTAVLTAANPAEPHGITSIVSHSLEEDGRAKSEHLEEIHVAELKSRDLHIKMIRQQWHDEVDELRGQLDKKKEIEIDLRVELHTREMAKLERRLAGNDRLEDKIADMRTNEYLLTKQVQDLRKQVNFVSLDAQQFAMQVEKNIKNTMEFIECEVESILHGHDSMVILRLPKSTFVADDLYALIRSLSSDQPMVGRELSCLRGWLLRFDAETLVRSFIVAALREWVFMSDFPNFSPSRMRLLSAYREAVVMHNGWRGLHNLERVAYHSLIETPDFQENSIPRNAKDAASRFSKTLAPLFPGFGNLNDEENIVFETWGEDQSVCKNRRYRFTGIFEAAYRLKATTVMTDMQYEFVVYPPGTRNPQENANPSPREQAIHNNQTRHNADLDLSLLAMMNVYSDAHREDLVDSALLHSTNFVTKSQSQRMESTTYKHNLIVANAGQSLVDIQAVINKDRTTKPSQKKGTENGLVKQVPRPSAASGVGDQYNSEGSIPARESSDKDSNSHRLKSERDNSQNQGALLCSRCGKTYKYRKALQNHVEENQCIQYSSIDESGPEGREEILFSASQRFEVIASPDAGEIPGVREERRKANAITTQEISGDTQSSKDTIENDKSAKNPNITQLKRHCDEREEICGKCEHRVRKADVKPGQTYATCYQCEQELPLEAFLKYPNAQMQIKSGPRKHCNEPAAGDEEDIATESKRKGKSYEDSGLRNMRAPFGVDEASGSADGRMEV